MPSMMRVAIESDNGTDPTKAFADAMWRENPKVSPSSWRVSQGLTVSKVGMDARFDVAGWQDVVAAGCNLLVVSRRTLGAVDGVPAGVVVVLWDDVGGDIPNGVDICLVLPNVADWMVLEQAVKDGVLQFYGVACMGWEDVAAWVEEADAAAAVVWGRKKRGGLRGLVLPFNVAEQQAFREIATRAGEEPVSVLEFAARRGWMVLAERPDRWIGPWGVLDVAADGAEKARAVLQPRLPDALGGLGVVVQAWMVASSMAGITATLARPETLRGCPWFGQAMEQPDMIDIAKVLDGVHEGA